MEPEHDPTATAANPISVAGDVAGDQVAVGTPVACAAEGATLSRRTLLAAGVVTAGAVGVAALAGCSASSKAADTSGAATVGSAGGGSGPGAGGDTSLAAASLAKVADIPVGNAISATLDGQPILISQPTAGTIVAFTAICTHMGCTVLPDGKDFQCPCHGSIYNAATGAVIQGPAPAALAKIATHVVDGEVMSGT